MKKLVLKHKLNFIDSELVEIKENNLHRKLRYGKAQGAHIKIKNKKMKSHFSVKDLNTRSSNKQKFYDLYRPN